MIIILRGKRWRLLYTNRMQKDLWGLCDPPDQKNKAIRIRQGLEEKKELEILLHECLHACIWDMDEDAIVEISKDLAEVLVKVGFHKSDS